MRTKVCFLSRQELEIALGQAQGILGRSIGSVWLVTRLRVWSTLVLGIAPGGSFCRGALGPRKSKVVLWRRSLERGKRLLFLECVKFCGSKWTPKPCSTLWLGVCAGVGLGTASVHPNPNATPLRHSLYALKVNIEVCDLMLV